MQAFVFSQCHSTFKLVNEATHGLERTVFLHLFKASVRCFEIWVQWCLVRDVSLQMIYSYFGWNIETFGALQWVNLGVLFEWQYSFSMTCGDCNKLRWLWKPIDNICQLAAYLNRDWQRMGGGLFLPLSYFRDSWRIYKQITAKFLVLSWWPIVLTYTLWPK